MPTTPPVTDEQSEAIVARTEPPLDAQAVRDVLDAGAEFSQAEREELEVKILEAKRQEWARAASLLKKEHERQQEILRQMEDRDATTLELKEQKAAVRKAYDALRLYTVESVIQVPDQIYDLLDTDGCTKRQKVWLLWYCHNGGNPVGACEKSSVSYRTYQKWISDSHSSPENIVFRTAKEDVERAQMDVAEQILKQKVAKGDMTALVFYLKGRHDTYKPQSKVEAETTKRKTVAKQDWSGADAARKQIEFRKAMAEGEDE